MRRHFGMMIITALLLLSGAMFGAGGDRQLAVTTPILPGFAESVTDGGSPRAACAINNMQGAIAAGYLNWPVPGGGMAVYFDPAGSGGAGAPGCGANPYPFFIQNVQLEFADSTMFGQPSGPGTLGFSVGVNCPGTDGDPCSQPVSQIFRSSVTTFTIPPEGSLRDFTIPINTCVAGPFFVIVYYESWTGLASRTPSLLWDAVARPRCRQYITTNFGASWTDHEDYFTDGSTGWADFVVNGNTVDTCDPAGNCGGPVPIGACCLPDGSCLDNVTAGECETTYGGIWQGADTICSGVSCPQPPLGACCNGILGCTEEDEFDCGYTWLGAGTTCGGDCDGDTVADSCAVAMHLVPDCQPNGVPDSCDLASGTSLDLNGNGIPDECESFGYADLNCDGAVDVLDIPAFVMALIDPTTYATTYPWCSRNLADCNHDGQVDGRDIQLFTFKVMGLETEIFYTQLAGNSLVAYPYFEYVRAFNQNATIQVALDPTQFPDIFGKTGDIYITAKKTEAQWQADPSLVDVTPGGAMAATFSGTTIQGDTFTVVAPGELSGYAGTGLGVGYDVVIDFNRNGVLDPGDFIDGYGNEAGLYVVADTTVSGPLAVTNIPTYDVGQIYGIPSGFTLEDIYYPTNIASMGKLPMVVVSHGNGHNYQWYGHIGHHLASYGYVVMSHQNATGAGIDSCSLTTCEHTDAFISKLPLIASGILNNHVDTHHIVWIGHSRGAEGVARGYDRITDSPPSYTPTNYKASDIVLISSMAPTDFLGPASSNPHAANYHLWTGSADADVNGGADCDLCQTFHLHDRATRYSQSTIIQGAGHGDFHDGGGSSVADGPCLIGRPTTHLIQLGYLLPLVKHYVEGNIPATDFLWRQYERFHPIGVDTSNPCIVVSNEYRNGSDHGNTVIDDYQSGTGTGVSSSGGSVTYNVDNLTEGLLNDNNSSFTWMTSDPFNGATQDGPSDVERGVVFDWNNSNKYYEWEVIPAYRDFSNDLYISFRGAQGTQHPYTLTPLGIKTCTLTLRDGNGVSSSIGTGAYGGGFGQPYARDGGYFNEMRTIRVRLTDFLTNGSGLDLSNIVAVRLNFGPSWGTSSGRFVIDQLMLDNGYPPFFTPLTMTLPSGVPEYMSPTSPTTINVAINEGSDTIVAGSPQVHYRYEPTGAWQTAPLTHDAGELYHATLPPPSCDDRPEFYFTVEGVVTGLVSQPAGAPGTTFSSFVGELIVVLDDNFQTDQGWTVENIAVAGGAWQRAVPLQCVPPRGDPPSDYDGSGYCYVTQNNTSTTSCNTDVDGGPTRLISPLLNMAGLTNPVLRYARWWYNDDLDSDPFDVEVSNDNGATWTMIEHVVNLSGGWVPRTVYLKDYITLTSQMKIRFSATDQPNNSLDEAGVDAVKIFDVHCSE
ncbi:MAG TPA: hypothetical protein VMV94_13830 [Phycisphaerae bacterium]|nr:hypothetical protein [Phycisphaerae bacterium]